MSVAIHCTASPGITAQERELLREIRGSRRYPVTRFELRSTREPSLRSTALDNVHLRDPGEGMEEVKARAALLRSLEEKGLIVLNFELISYVKSDYQPYHDSALFTLLSRTVEEGRGREGFLFDYPFLKKGLAALTLRGRYAAGETAGEFKV